MNSKANFSNNNACKKKHVIVGMSGGVDSSVAALLLKQQGHTVEGLFMKNWEEDDTEEYCAASIDVEDAQQVCDKLDIPLHRVNFAAEYWDNVFEHFLSEYRAGRTPNPDILCNKEIKFKAFLDYALGLGAEYIATGHYAQIQHNEDEYQLLTGLDANKDQSYFLYTLQQHQLSHSLFPIGTLQKSKVRAIATEAGFANHNKKDSTGICFIGERKFKDFLNNYLPAHPGEMRTPEGKTIGEHDGLMFYTIGQRQGLGIGGLKDNPEEPWYVVEKDCENNILIVAQSCENPLLFSKKLTCNQAHWVAGDTPNTPLNCQAKTRYRQASQTCVLEKITDDQFVATFKEPQRAVTLGQSVVFYQGEVCLGGGIITAREPA